MRRISLEGPAVQQAQDGTVLTFQCPGCDEEFPTSER